MNTMTELLRISMRLRQWKTLRIQLIATKPCQTQAKFFRLKIRKLCRKRRKIQIDGLTIVSMKMSKRPNRDLSSFHPMATIFVMKTVPRVLGGNVDMAGINLSMTGTGKTKKPIRRLKP